MTIELLRSDYMLVDAIVRRFAHGAVSEELRQVLHGLAAMSRLDHVAVDLDDESREAWATGLSADHIRELLADRRDLCDVAEKESAISPVGPPLIFVGGRFLYLRRLAAAEERIAASLATSRDTVEQLVSGVNDAAITHAAEAIGVTVPHVGRIAQLLNDHAISILTGGPGTGKTWSTARALRVLDELATAQGVSGLRFAITAPTAKAERRASESLRASAAGEWRTLSQDTERSGTLYGLLGVTPDNLSNATLPAVDIIIVDEVSMADLPVLDALFHAAQMSARKCHILLVGDPDQLASVNVGAVLADVVDAEADMESLITRLTVVQRTKNNALPEIASAIRSARTNPQAADIVVELLRTKAPQVRFVETANDEPLQRRVFEHARRLVRTAHRGDVELALLLTRTFTVLSATHRGPGSVRFWNELVRAHLEERHLATPGQFMVGQPVLVTRNQRNLDVFNGDLGVVVLHDDVLHVAFAGRSLMKLAEVGYLVPAWAMTIHKSQGSEYREVVACLPGEDSPLLTAELIYTGATRAIRGLTVVGSEASLRKAVTTPVSRVSGLSYRLAR